MNGSPYLVAGLGNPGPAYINTLHNVGFRVLDRLAEELSVSVTRSRFQGLTGSGQFAGRKVHLLKPMTFMNASGGSIKNALNWYRIPLDRLLVVYDDIDLEPGVLRIRKGGSAGTHNGMRSVIRELGEEGFPRLRIGVGRPREGWDLVDHVLAIPEAEPAEKISAAEERAAAAVKEFLTSGIEAAMQKYNGAAE
ncbi:MAG TPA: aminoacyl-tRNA hydrolase [Clostridiales bacterium]|nr:aminoacyl-tRNA hydrolase [Clostridiales bacterium]